MGKPFDERFEEFVGLVSAIEKEIQRIRTTECGKLGLRGADLMCLYQIKRSDEPLTSAELARRTGVTRAAVSRTLAHLEEEGLVVVGPWGTGASRAAGPEGAAPQATGSDNAASQTLAPRDDARAPDVGGAAAGSRYRAPIRLTELGSGLMTEAGQSIRRVMGEVDGALSESERAQMYRSLESVLTCLRSISRA